MSRLLYNTVIQALKEAHDAYLRQHKAEYRDCMKVAESAIAAIRSLGTEDDCGREMELMGLNAEAVLLQVLPRIHRPAELIPQLEMAVLQMLLPPSKVVSRDAPLVSHCEDVLNFFGGMSEQIAKDLEQASMLYARLTDGGGGGVAEIYRAQMANQRGEAEEANRWARLALERMCGDKWIEPIAKGLIHKTDRILQKADPYIMDAIQPI